MSGLQKNAASQKWIVFAFNRTDNTPKAGDAANITANLRIDGGGADAVDDANPTELEDGYYYFDLTQAETNGDMILICPVSSTGDIQVIGVPGVERTSGITAANEEKVQSLVDGTGIADDLDIQMRSLTITHDGGVGVAITGTSIGLDINATAGIGIDIDGTTSGVTADGAAGPGVHAGGTTFGIEVTASGGPGLSCVASAGNNNGITATGYGSGDGIEATGGGTSGSGVQIVGGATNGEGLEITGAGTGEGLICTGGADNASGIKAVGGTSNGLGVEIIGDGSGEGLKVTGGDSSGAGIQVIGGATNGIAVDLRGTGAGEGLKSTGGATGIGVEIVGGSTSGSALKVWANGTNDLGLEIVGIGSGHGMSVTGGATGHGLYCFGGATSGDGIYAAGQTDGDGMTLVAAGGGQYDLNADIHGVLDTVTTCTTTTTNTDMVGTNNAALAATALSTAVWTAARAGALTDWIDGGRLDLLLDAIPTTAMRGTDGANTTVPYAAGTAAALHATTDALVTTVDTVVDTILTDTNELQTNQGNWATATTVTTVTGNVDGNVGGNVTGSVGSLAAQAKADVNAEALDVLVTDTHAEPGQGTPAATLNLKDKIGYLFKNWRNKKTQDATTFELYNDDAATVDQKATVSDDGTDAEKGEIITGP